MSHRELLPKIGVFMKRVIKAGVFKAECLKMMDEVKKTKNPIIVTKHKIPIVKIVPVEDETQSLFGKMKNTGRVKGDIIQPIGEVWDADL